MSRQCHKAELTGHQAQVLHHFSVSFTKTTRISFWLSSCWSFLNAWKELGKKTRAGNDLGLLQLSHSLRSTMHLIWSFIFQHWRERLNPGLFTEINTYYIVRPPSFGSIITDCIWLRGIQRPCLWSVLKCAGWKWIFVSVSQLYYWHSVELSAGFQAINMEIWAWEPGSCLAAFLPIAQFSQVSLQHKQTDSKQ